MASIKFGGIPQDIISKLTKKKGNPQHLNSFIFPDIREYEGFEIAYNKLTFSHVIDDNGTPDKAKSALDKLYAEFQKKNPEEFFKAVEENKERKFPFFNKYIEKNSQSIEASGSKYSTPTKSNSKVEHSLKAIQRLLDHSKYQKFNDFNKGIAMNDEQKSMVRDDLMVLISHFGAKIEKDGKNSTTKIFIMDNPTTRKGKEYVIRYHSMPYQLKDRFRAESYLTFEINPKTLREGEGKQYNSKLYEEYMTEEENKEFGLEDVNEALSVQQRRQRSVTMRRFATKIAAARQRSSKRMANADHLEKRARHAAINLLRKRFAGAMGVNYVNLSPTQKIQVDQKVEAKKALIGKIAARLLPKIKAKEAARLSGAGKTGK